MSPDPDPEPTADLLKREYFSETWASLPWTPWIPFTAAKEEFRQIPQEPGLYRIRPAGKDYLMYIGETKRPLHTRLADLRMELRNRDLMPWTEPHTESPALWAWQDAEGFGYECSGTPLDASGVRCVMSRSGLKGGCEGESDFVNGGFCLTDKRGLDTEMRNKNFLPVSPFSNERYLIV